MSRQTSTLLIVLAVAVVLAALVGASLVTYCCGGESRNADQTAVEQAVRAFEKAAREANPEALVSTATPAYIKRYYGGDAADIGEKAEEIGSILGRPVDRQIESITVTGDTATVLALQHAPGGTDNDAVQVGLVRQDGKWLVDSTTPRTAQVPNGSTLIEMDLKDFSFGYDPDEFQRERPFVIRARNTGGQAHMVAIWKVPDDAMLIRVIEATDVLPAGTEKVANSIVFDKGEEGDITVKKGLKPGRYMLTCFLSDVTVPELTPHYDRGMLTEFRVK